MEKAAKMMDVVVAGRMAKMKVVVTHPARESALTRTVEVLAEAIRLAGDAEFNTHSRSKYRNALIN